MDSIQQNLSNIIIAKIIKIKCIFEIELDNVILIFKFSKSLKIQYIIRISPRFNSSENDVAG